MGDVNFTLSFLGIFVDRFIKMIVVGEDMRAITIQFIKYLFCGIVMRF